MAQTKVSALDEESNIYHRVFDAPLTESVSGQKGFLSQQYERKPLILALVYTRCTGICSPFLLQLKDDILFNLRDSSFRVVVLSFDPQDSKADMNSLQKRFGLEGNSQWLFATTDSIRSLNTSIGFAPVWDSLRKQYNHEALLVGINSGGYITKKLIGMRSSHDLEKMVASIHNVFSPSYRLPGSSTLFSCFNYDPKSGRSTPGLGLLFVGLPAGLALLIVILLRLMVRKQTPAVPDK
ncbi:MAG: hypothetical protein JST06_01580 [Bacteroidetes bacterium]|nr:hypothetical protein [Bacteroidota bacterium]